MKSFGLINLGVLPLLLEAMNSAYSQQDPREQEQRRPQHEQEARPERTQQEGRPERQEPPRRQEEGRPARQQPPPMPEPQPRYRPEKQPQEPQPGRAPNREEPRRTEEPHSNRRPAPSPRPEEPARARAPQEPQRQPQAQPPAREAGRGARREYDSQHRGAWQDRRAHDWQSEHRSWVDRGGYNGYRIPDGNFRGHFGPSHRFRMSSFPIQVIGGFPRFQYGGFWFSVMDPWPEYWSDNWYGSDDLYIEYFGGGYYLRNRMHPMDRIAVTVMAG